ncbi:MULTISPECIES: caspase family protein [Streptomyces]|uniref:VMAP-C domain-containing protein n=1 Tax=Streptomyces TaxID=1883 RepID=UPI00068EB35B|nr:MULTISPECIES: caspase family protein [Streptomyces]
MAGLRAVDDPARVHAVVVGVERYPRHPDWDLPGAVDDALRFYKWLRKGGVPEDNIQLLLAPDEASRTSLDALTAAGELTWCQTWGRDALMDAFAHGLDGRTGDLLYVYWGSHGVLGQGDRRLLLCPDASPKDKRCVDTANLLEYLQRDDLAGFTEQVLLFDTCATFLEHHNQPTGPAIADFPTVRRHPVAQFALCAAAAGQVAENDPALRSGVFSHAVIDWLETHAADLHPDPAALLTHVRAATPDTQTPVSIDIDIRTLDGSRERLLWPRAPLPASTGRSHLALALHEALDDGDLRARCLEHLAVQCPGAHLGSCPSDEQLAHTLLTVERAMAALVEVVHSRNRRAADQLLSLGRTHGVPGLLSHLEYTALREVLSHAPHLPPTARVIAAVRATQPLERAWLPPKPQAGHGSSVAQLMACVEHFEKHTGGQSMAHPGRQLVPAVIRFTELLAAMVPDVRAELHEWAARVSRRLNVDPGGLAERRADALAWLDSLDPAAGRPRVVAQLDAAPPDSTTADGDERYTCVMWLDTGAGDLVQAAEQSPDPLAPRDVVRRIQRTVSLLRGVTEETPVVEILLQPDAVQLPVDSWNGADDGDELPILLGVEWATALRCAPLACAEREEKRQEGIKSRWAGRHNDTVVFLDDEHAQGFAGYGALMADVGAARAVVRAGPDGRGRLVQAALRLGYPVVLWDRRAPGQVQHTHFDPLQPERAVDGLPWRIRDYRAQACVQPAARPVCPVVLLEAADRPLPPVLSLTGLSESPDHPAPSDSEEASPR